MLTPCAHTRCAPAALLHPSRLDVIVKFLLFRSLLTNEDPDVLDLYARHIARRTGGFEGDKRSVDDYVSHARALLVSLQARGFDAATPVRVGRRNGLPLDGAHRIAACLALGIDVVVEHVEQGWGAAWGHDWFLSHGFSTVDIDRLVRTYARLTSRAVVFIFWGPTRERWDDLAGSLRSDAAAVAVSDLAIDPADVAMLVEDVYAWRLGPMTPPRIADKGRALCAGPATVRAILAEAPPHVTDLAAYATAVKQRLRGRAGTGAHDFWTTVHASDEVAEARYLTDLLFNRNYWRTLALRRGAGMRRTFLEWLDRYVRVLASHGIDRDDACIVGSAVLEAVGVRESTDIDCIIGAREPQFHAGVAALGAGVDLVTRGYHRRADGGPAFADADVIADPRLHFRMRGLKFANPEIVVDRKRQHGRPKDVADVGLWERRTAVSEPLPPPNRAILLFTTTPVDVVRHATLEAMRVERARRGEVLVVAGVPSRPASMTGFCVEGPAGADELPVDLFLDDDPCVTLVRCGADPAVLLEAASAHSGPATDPGQTFRRLRGLAWTARWMRAWLEVVRPDEVVVEDHSVTGLLLRAVARQVAPAVGPPDPDAIAEACRSATEHVRIVAAVPQPARSPVPGDMASDADSGRLLARIGALEEASTNEAREQAWWRAAAESHRGALWLWGAGALGRSASEWLAAMGARVAGVVDADPGKHGTLLGGVRVLPPTALRDVPAAGLLVAITSMHAGAIRQAIQDLGRPAFRVIVLAGAAPSQALDEHGVGLRSARD